MRLPSPDSRAASTVRGIVAIPLAFWVAHRLLHPVFLGLGLAGHKPDGSHILHPGLLAGSDVRQIGDTALAVSLLLLTERGGWSPKRLVRRSKLPTSPVAFRQALLGLAVGLGSAAVVMAVLAGTGCAHVARDAAPSGFIARSMIVWAGVFVMVGTAEEFGNRGYALRSLTDGAGFWAAALLTSSWFAWLHLQEGDPWFGALSTGLFGFFAACTWRATGSLGFAIGYHAAWDYAQSVIFGVPDSSFTMAGALLSTRTSGPVWLSGGIVGPEGSVVTYAQLAIATAVAIAIGNRAARQRPRATGP